MSTHDALRAEPVEGPTVEMVTLSNVLPNPYRQIDAYPINDDKVEALLKSFGTSGFWDGSIQGRESPSHPGKIEIAFGHHRLAAAHRKALTAIGIVVAPRSNADMIRMMADENRSEFRHDGWITVETIATVVEAYARGEIELDPPAPGNKGGGNQPTYNLPGGKLYSLATVARFLHWTKPSTGQATSACALAFEGYLERRATTEAIQHLAPAQRSEVAVQTITAAARYAREEAKAVGLSTVKSQEAAKRAALTTVAAIQQTSGFKAREEAEVIGRRAARELAEAATVGVVTAKMADLKRVHQAQRTLAERKLAAAEGASPGALRRLQHRSSATLVANAMQTFEGMVGALEQVDASTLATDPRADTWRATLARTLTVLRSIHRDLKGGRS